MDPILQRIPIRQEPLTPKRVESSQGVPSTTEISETTTQAQATTVPVTNATTAAPDPDAEVCSERPFDAFMQMKNGSIYAFRGESLVIHV